MFRVLIIAVAIVGLSASKCGSGGELAKKEKINAKIAAVCIPKCGEENSCMSIEDRDALVNCIKSKKKCWSECATKIKAEME